MKQKSLAYLSYLTLIHKSHYMRIYQYLLFGCLVLELMSSCSKTPEPKILDGSAQGTYYHISFYADDTLGVANSIDSIFIAIDNSLSLWREKSIINAVNANQDPILDSIFIQNFISAKKFYQLTDGAFDITIGSLVKSYGFTTEKRKVLSEKQIDTLLKISGMDKISLQDSHLYKKYPEIQLDFNAIAQGYTSDAIAKLFRKRGIDSFVIDVGGEVMCGNEKPNGKAWSVGIERPTETKEEQIGKSIAQVYLKNHAIVTSGNYRKYYIVNGVKYSHTIDPKTGHPVWHNLLSASVIASEATSADALATAFMVMGLEKTQKFLQSHSEYAAYLIYSDKNGQMKTWQSPNFGQYLNK